MSQLDSLLSYLKKIKGVDGIAIYDVDAKLIESLMPKEFLSENTGSEIKDIVDFNISKLGDMESTVLLTEKGAWYITKVADMYVLILSGYNHPVDIPDLIEIAAKMKEAILTKQ